MNILVTGSAGFIGYHLCKRLLKEGKNVVGIDNLNSYYDRKLKEARNKKLFDSAVESNYRFLKGNIENKELINDIFKKYKPKYVINLAAQAGVRYSIENPHTYIKSNIEGFQNILDNCKESNINHLIYASSSSVYGGNKKLPFSENDLVNHPVSLYAATKKSNELMAHCYSHLYSIPSTGLRFFTVYGPWGRPDMAPMIFADSILKGIPIKVFNNGNMKRDFTYIDDIVEGVFRCCFKPASSSKNFDFFNPDPSKSFAKHRIFNIGNGKPVDLMEFIHILEKNLGVEAIKDYQPMQKGDVKDTWADTNSLEKWINFKSETSIYEGVKKFADWYKDFYSK